MTGNWIGALLVEAGLYKAQTADAAYKILKELELADHVFANLAQKISHNAESYIQKYANLSLKVRYYSLRSSR